MISALSKITCLELVREDDPILERLALYVMAHRNYLATLPYDLIKDYKVNWGLRKVMKLEESEEVEEVPVDAQTVI